MRKGLLFVQVKRALGRPPKHSLLKQRRQRDFIRETHAYSWRNQKSPAWYKWMKMWINHSRLLSQSSSLFTSSPIYPPSGTLSALLCPCLSLLLGLPCPETHHCLCGPRMTLLTCTSIFLAFALLILPLVAVLCPQLSPCLSWPPAHAWLLVETGNPRFMFAEHGGKCPQRLLILWL